MVFSSYNHSRSSSSSSSSTAPSPSSLARRKTSPSRSLSPSPSPSRKTTIITTTTTVRKGFDVICDEMYVGGCLDEVTRDMLMGLWMWTRSIMQPPDVYSHLYLLFRNFSRISTILYLFCYIYSISHLLYLTHSLSCTIMSFTSQSATLLLRDGLTQPFAEALLRCVEDLLEVAKSYYAFIRVDMDEVSPCVSCCMCSMYSLCSQLYTPNPLRLLSTGITTIIFSRFPSLVSFFRLSCDRYHCIITSEDKG